MKNRREFLATTIPAAALLTTSSGENRASVAGLSAEAEGERKSTVVNHSMPEGRDPADKAEDPRIRRGRLAGPEQVTKDATVAEIAADGTMTGLGKGTNNWICTPGAEKKMAPAHGPRRRSVGDVCWGAICASACLRNSVGRQRIPRRRQGCLDDVLRSDLSSE